MAKPTKEKEVVMTRRRVADELYGRLQRRLDEVARRADEGSISFEPTMDALQQIIEGRFGQKLDEYPVTIDYGMSLADMIEAGHYDWTNSDITAEHFPIKGRGKAEVKLELVHFDRAVSTDEALEELDKQGLRPAKIEELLAFGAAYPEIQHEFPVICLGSVWSDRDDGRSVPDLGRRGSRRRLYLDWVALDWPDYCRFLAVRK